jgi:hypothetical protein
VTAGPTAPKRASRVIQLCSAAWTLTLGTVGN